MKITVYQAKGAAGKTPIATNIALDRGYAIGTNEAFHVYEGFINEEDLIALDLTESFPDFKLLDKRAKEEAKARKEEEPNPLNIVFDLAGAISKASHSITSALLQSDLVIVPISNEVKSLAGGIGTLREFNKLKGFNAQVLVIATKLKKGRKEIFGKDEWDKSEDFKNVHSLVRSAGFDYTVLPSKFSSAYDAIFERELSIHQICKENALFAHSFREVKNQFDDIYKFLDTVKHAR